MSPTWPETLPAFVQEQGYSESPPDQTIESQMDAGPPKVRRRFTMNWRPIQASIWVTSEQFAVFEHFYRTTLSGGVSTFFWVNPITQNPVLFRFRRPPPVYTPFGAGNVAIRMNLYQMREFTAFRFDSDEITFDSTEHSFDAADLF